MLETKDPITRLRDELERPPLFSEPLLEILDEIEQTYLPAPVDADGVLIRPGDMLIRGQDTPIRVVSVEWYIDGIRVFNENGFGVNFWDYSHVDPETLEDILNEMIRETEFSKGRIAKYVRRIRRAVIYEK